MQEEEKVTVSRPRKEPHVGAKSWKTGQYSQHLGMERAAEEARDEGRANCGT